MDDLRAQPESVESQTASKAQTPSRGLNPWARLGICLAVAVFFATLGSSFSHPAPANERQFGELLGDLTMRATFIAWFATCLFPRRWMGWLGTSLVALTVCLSIASIVNDSRKAHAARLEQFENNAKELTTLASRILEVENAAQSDTSPQGRVNAIIKLEPMAQRLAAISEDNSRLWQEGLQNDFPEEQRQLWKRAFDLQGDFAHLLLEQARVAKQITASSDTSVRERILQTDLKPLFQKEVGIRWDISDLRQQLKLDK